MKMKTLLTTALAFLLALSCYAEKLTFKDVGGKEWSGELVKVEPHALALETDAGIERVPLETLPKDLQTRFGFNAEAAAKYQQALTVQNAATIAENASKTSSVPVAASSATPTAPAKPLSEYEQAKAKWIEQTAGQNLRDKSKTYLPDGQRLRVSNVQGTLPAHLRTEKAYNEWRAEKVRKAREKGGKLNSGGL